MRDILFRGKRADNGEWVQGFFTKRKFAGKEYFAIEQSERKIVTYDYEYVMQPYEVIPVTVGQYTGLTDENGKKIFEGDIVVVNIKGNNTICKVAWAYNVAQFQLWQTNTISNTPTALNLGNYYCEVIGNIHDNPELLKGGNE